MTEDYTGLWHHVYFDSFFMATKLMKLLLERKSYARGRTAHARRKDWPKEFSKPKQLKMKWAESRKLQHEDVTTAVRHNVLLLSTNSDPRTDEKSGRGKEQIEIPCPKAVVNYTQNMGGSDISDQKREYYGVGRS
jgi:hypothetical protein